MRIALTISTLTLLLALNGCNKQEATNTAVQTGTVAFKGTIKESIRNSTPDFKLDTKAPEHAPNIVVILADDLGFADISPFGSEINTPNIEKLAANGLRYNNFTVTAMCSPCRIAHRIKSPQCRCRLGIRMGLRLPGLSR